MGSIVLKTTSLLILYICIRSTQATSHCLHNEKVAQSSLQCSSCRFRCGEDFNGNFTHKQCSCDPLCLAYGDCCQDFELSCQEQKQNGLKILKDQFKAGGRVFGTNCKRLIMKKGDQIVESSVMTVDVCPDGRKCYSSGDITKLNRVIPVTDLITGVQYLNAECALCNGVKQGKPWNLQLSCSAGKGVFIDENDQKVDTIDELRRVLIENSCAFIFEPPHLVSGEQSSVRSPCFIDVIDECDINCQNEFIVNGCQKSAIQNYIYAPGVVHNFFLPEPLLLYKNYFCALCKSKQELVNIFCEDNSNTMLPEPAPTSIPGGGGAGRPGPSCVDCGVGGGGRLPDRLIPDRGVNIGFSTFSLAVLLDFNPVTGLRVGTTPENHNDNCPPGEIFVAEEKACREKICPKGTRKQGDDCIVSSFSLHFHTAAKFEYLHDKKVFENEVKKTNFRKHLQEFVDYLRKLIDIHEDAFKKTNDQENLPEIELLTNVSETSSSVNTIITTKIDYVNESLPFKISAFTDSEKESLIEKLNSVFVKLLLQTDTTLSNVNIKINQTTTFQGELSGANNCTWLRYGNTEFVIKNKTKLYLPQLDRIYTNEYFQMTDDEALVCVDNELTGAPINAPDINDGILGMVSLILILVSMACLLVRIGLQCVVSIYKTRAGILQFKLCIALFFAFLSLLVSGLMTIFYPYTLYCVIAAAWMYWMFLAAFLWMVCISVDTWKAFRSSASFARGKSTKKPIIVYSIFAWCLPIVFLVGVFALDNIDISNIYKPQFGHPLCWFNQRYALLFYFGGPLACCLLLCFTLFIITANSIRKGLEQKIQSTKENSNKIGIYVRLFIIMGLSWTFGFLAAFVRLKPPYQSVLWLVFIILNASQGILIFFSFVCRKHVCQELCGCKKDKKDGTSYPSTGNSSGSTGATSTGQTSK